ncbi:hypothetical protein IGJ55_002006 [Enterococcus sp. AZ170]|uniref:EutP/PduV family microcompartment system protein n=1 Tax=Enterococcus sp. AZ170 TaxID=2774747 RepID=UPI003D2FFB71
MKKRILIIGPNQQHNHIIAQAIEDSEQPIRKVANILYTNETIIVPNSYLESPWMHKHIISLQQKASKALFLVPIPSIKKSYPPNFAHALRVPVIGVVMYKEKEHTVNEKIITKKMLEEIGCIKQQYWLHINKEEIRAFVEEIR